MTYPYCKNARIRRQTAYDVSNSDQTDRCSRKTTIALHKNSDNDALTFNIDFCMVLLYFRISRESSDCLNSNASLK